MKAIVACRPADEEECRILEALTGKPLTRYSGETPAACVRCAAGVMVGPRSQQLVSAGLAEPHCFPCAVLASAGACPMSLGNPEGSAS